MSYLTISLFQNKILFEIIKEIKLFSKYKLIFNANINEYFYDEKKIDQLIILDNKFTKQDDCQRLKKRFPLIIISNKDKDINFDEDFVEYLKIPFTILELEKKIIQLFARYKFDKSSFINLLEYTINKNERKIKKGELELNLTEREISFLILFSEHKKPLSRNFILHNVWKYSPKSDTHTVETHIHRLRKKILEKFGDNNFIKNNKKGYYI